MAGVADVDPLAQLYQRKREAAKKDAGKAIELAEDLTVNGPALTAEARRAIEKRPAIPEAAVEEAAKVKGVSLERAREIARDVEAKSEPVLVIESVRAENELRDVFENLYAAEVQNLQTCPVVVNRGGTKQPCGRELKSIQEALVHHSFHILYGADYRTQRATLNDISEKLYPTDIKGVRAALTAEERDALFRNPAMRDRLLKRRARALEAD